MERRVADEVQELKEIVGGLRQGMKEVNTRLIAEMNGVKETMLKMQEILSQLVERQGNR